MRFLELLEKVLPYYENREKVQTEAITLVVDGHVDEIREDLSKVLICLFKNDTLDSEDISRFKQALSEIDKEKTLFTVMVFLIDSAIILSKKIKTPICEMLSDEEKNYVTKAFMILDLVDTLKKEAGDKFPTFLRISHFGLSQLYYSNNFRAKYPFDLEDFRLKCWALHERGLREHARSGETEDFRSLPKGTKPQNGSRKTKPAEEFYLYGRNRKIDIGDMGNTALKAFREKGKEYFFFQRREFNSVLTSKILTFISKKHFSSEHFGSLGGIFSSKHPNYTYPLTPSRAENIQKFKSTLSRQGYIDGLGIIDETCQFICEGDYNNTENVGLSSDENFLCKIDHDRCSPFCTTMIQFEPYVVKKLEPSNNIHRLTQILIIIADSNEELLCHHKNFIREKALCRIKIAFLSDALIDYFFDQFYDGDENNQRQKDKEALKEKRDAWAQYVKENRFNIEGFEELLQQAHEEAIEYVNEHKIDEKSKVLASFEEIERSLIEPVANQRPISPVPVSPVPVSPVPGFA